MKTLHEKFVYHAAQEVANVNEGKFTTLEVKNFLREQNFKAIQEDISIIVDKLASEMKWDYYVDCDHRVYTFYYFNEDVLSKYEVKELIDDLGSDIFAITFTKKDSSTRIMQCKAIKVKRDKQLNDNWHNNITVVDVANEDNVKTFKIESLNELRHEGTKYIIK
jgi:hypothetical protein